MKWRQGLTDYQHYLKIERGLMDNSITNYVLDVEKLILFLEQKNITETPISISKQTTQQFIYEISASINPRSQARTI